MIAFIRSLTLSCLLVGAAHAQRYSFKQYGQDAGLTNLDVSCLLQDSTGFLWVGTENGLFRYDGHQFRAYTKAQGLPSAQITALHQTVAGELWAGTSAGLARLHGETFETVRSGRGNGTLAIASDSVGTVYVGTVRGLLVSAPAAAGRKREFQLHPVPGEGLQHVYAIAVENPARIWYSCGLSLCRLENGKARAVEGLGVPPEGWRSLLLDRQGTLWARSYASLIALARRSGKFVRQDQGLPPSARIAAVAMDRDGEIYVPTSRGLAHRTAEGWRLIRRANGLPTATVDCFLQDREGSAWIGFDGGGLVRWLGYKSTEIWTEAEGLSHDVVWSLRRDNRGVLWAATNAGVSSFLPGRGRWQARPHPLVGDGPTLAFAAGATEGTWWLGKAPGGAVFVDARSGVLTRFGPASGLTNQWVYNLATDQGGQPWVGTASGVFLGRLRAGTWRFDRVELPGQSTNVILALLRDTRGRIWVSTSGGLNSLENGVWRRFQVADGLLHDNVTYITEAPDHAIWVSYGEPAGISRLEVEGDRLSARHFGLRDGLRPAKAFFLRFDRRGWLWLGTDAGVDRFDGRSWLHLDKSDGMAINDCDHNAFFDDEDGSIWIGTSKGLTHFLHPERLTSRTAAVPVVITWLQLGSSRAPLAGGVSVPYSRRSLSVGFAALTFVSEDSVRFRHRLLGLDPTWAVTQQAEAHYPGLPPGQFTLEVQASGADGNWRPATARVSFQVLPPWWRTWWALTAGAVLLVLTARGLWAWRVRSIMSRQLELERAVEDRTSKLVAEQRHALEEKARAEHEKLIVEQQKVEIEHLLRESQQAARAKTEFLANMSHEIRTPLNGIMGMTDLVLQSPLTGEQTEFLRLARVAADSLLLVINDILDFSKIEAGRLELDPVEFDLAQLMRDALAPLELLARRKGLGWGLHLVPSAPPRIVGDPGRLRQVLLNLAGNAVKFTETGSVEIYGEVQDLPDGSHRVYCRVQDTGIGIPQDKHSLIFEPFRQADGSTSRRYGGTGLGLSICGRLVSMMGGKIWLESHPAGSTFHFTVAARAAAPPVRVAARPQQEPAAQPETPPPEGLRILLAEDNMVNQTLARRLLERAGCTVDCAMNGSEALDAWSAGQFDLILMDVQMPVMDGFEATAELRRREAGTGVRTPVIALTANAMPGDRERCMAAGMDEFVSKPMKRAELFQAIAAVLGPKTTAV